MSASSRAFKESVVDMQNAGFFPPPAGASQSDAEGSVAARTSPEAAGDVPVTEPQLEVWLSDQLGEEASCSYNESFTLHMRGKVNESVLKETVLPTCRSARCLARHL